MRIIDEVTRIMSENAYYQPQSTPASRRLAEADKLLRLPVDCPECAGSGYVKPGALYVNVCLTVSGRAPQRVFCKSCFGSGKRP